MNYSRESSFTGYGIIVPAGKTGNGVRCECPKCYELHKKREKTLSVDTERGLFNCFRCDWSGCVGSSDKGNVIALDPARTAAQERENEQKAERDKNRLSDLYTSSYPLQHPEAKPSRDYLNNRLGGHKLLGLPNDLRHHRNLPYFDTEINKCSGHHQAMLATVRDVNGQGITLHRTYITQDGKKAAVGSPKKLMPPVWPATVTGGAIQLYNPVITALTPKRKGQKSCWNSEPERHGHIHPDQLEAWWAATEKLASTITAEAGETKPYYKGNGELGRDYLQFVILTGLRRREASRLQWQAVDFDAGTFSITENKSHRELVLPMTDYQREILLRRQIATGGKGRVFPIEEPRRLVARVGEICKQHFTVHDLRRSFITYCDIQDIGPTVRKALVNHALIKEGKDIQRKGSGDITDRYVQLDLGRVLAASQLITNYVLSQAKVKADNVMPITSAAQKKLA